MIKEETINTNNGITTITSYRSKKTKRWDSGEDPYLSAPTISESHSDMAGDKQHSKEEMVGGEDPHNITMSTTNTSTVSVSTNFSNNNIITQKKKSASRNKKCLPWKDLTDRIRQGIIHTVVALSVFCARYPRSTIVATVVLSLGLLIAGVMTNISFNVDPDVLFTPSNTITMQHEEWLDDFDPDQEDNTNDASSGASKRKRQRSLLFNPLSSLLPHYDEEDEDDNDMWLHNETTTTTTTTTTTPTEFKYELLSSSAPLLNSTLSARRQLHHEPNRSKEGMSRIPLTLLVHANGKNVATVEGMKNLFKAYHTVLNAAAHTCHDGERVRCSSVSALKLWDNNINQFAKTVKTDEDVQRMLAIENYVDGLPVDLHTIVGKPQMKKGRVAYAASYIMLIRVWVHRQKDIFARNAADGSIEYDEERDVLDALNNLKYEFECDGEGHYDVEFFTTRAFEDELFRGIAQDVPLLPVVIGIMVLFTCIAFAKRDRVKSKCLLGLGGVLTIVLSLLSGFGVMFCCGLPITPMTTMLPFVVLGIGLDDTFIITLAFNRTDENKDPVERVRETMEEVGLSISTTTLTTTLAFILGLISSIPSIYWLCFYAFTTILIDFIYQITFFVALTVLDARRIQANRTDCCTCFRIGGSAAAAAGASARSGSGDAEEEGEEEEDYEENGGIIVEMGSHEDDDHHTKAHKHEESQAPEQEQFFVDRFMGWYAEQLLRPKSKIVVIVLFLVYLVVCIYCTTQMEQAFRISDLTPNGSFIRQYFRSTQDYTTRTSAVEIYFRNMDQSDPFVREMMRKFVDDLVDTPGFGQKPAFCWVKDFDDYLELLFPNQFETMTFNKQVQKLLSVPDVKTVYGSSLRRNKQGDIKLSKCVVWYGNLDLFDVQNQLNTFRTERELAMKYSPRGKKGPDQWPIFTISDLYTLWEFYSIIIHELILTTLSAVVAVSIVTLFVVPHWTAIMYTLPTIVMLYIDLIGTLQFVGVRINAVSYIALVIAIGLMVDFILHMLIKFYESKCQTREEKVKDALQTMGTSILLGGSSTFIATIPMLFASSKLFSDIFDAFFAVVALSLFHGLIFLPVVLSMFGPEGTLNNNEDYVPFMESAGAKEGNLHEKNGEWTEIAVSQQVLVGEDESAPVAGPRVTGVKAIEGPVPVRNAQALPVAAATPAQTVPFNTLPAPESELSSGALNQVQTPEVAAAATAATAAAPAQSRNETKERYRYVPKETVAPDAAEAALTPPQQGAVAQMAMPESEALTPFRTLSRRD